jgi:hypothetical protein
VKNILLRYIKALFTRNQNTYPASGGYKSSRVGLGVELTTLPCKKIAEKPPRHSAIFNGRRLRRRPRPKLGCGAEEEEEEEEEEEKKKKKKKNRNT